MTRYAFNIQMSAQEKERYAGIAYSICVMQKIAIKKAANTFHISFIQNLSKQMFANKIYFLFFLGSTECCQRMATRDLSPNNDTNTDLWTFTIWNDFFFYGAIQQFSTGMDE